MLPRRKKQPREGPMYFVYIMTNRSRTLYTGVTNNLMCRAREHKTGIGSEFTAKYKLNRLVYFERFEDVHNAIERHSRPAFDPLRIRCNAPCATKAKYILPLDAYISLSYHVYTTGSAHMAVTMTSIRLDTDLADEAVKVLKAKSRTDAVHIALREIVGLKRFKKLMKKYEGKATFQGHID